MTNLTTNLKKDISVEQLSVALHSIKGRKTHRPICPPIEIYKKKLEINCWLQC